jgi:hypothetical protein
MLATPAIAREFTAYNGTYAPTTPTRADIELEYDGNMFFGYGTSPGWTDETAVIFEAPAGGPFTVAEIRYYAIGTAMKPSHFFASADIWGPPFGDPVVGPQFATGYGSWPPADWTTVDVTGMGMMVNTGDIVVPALPLFGTGDGIGLAYAYDDMNPGHSWAIWGGGWADDTYMYGVDDGVRLGLNYGGGTPAGETTWGAVKGMFR